MRVATVHEPAGTVGAQTSRLFFGLHRLLLRVSLAMANTFAWIFIYNYFSASEGALQAFTRTVLLYALAQAVVALATPYLARLLQHGARRAMALGAVLLTCGYVVLGAALMKLFADPTPFITLFAILLGLYRATYRVPFETERHGGAPQRVLSDEFALACVPLVAGLYLAQGNPTPSYLLYAAAALAAISLLALPAMHEVYERFAWGYRETFAQAMAPENRDVMRRAIFEGIVGAALLLLWPLAVYFIVAKSFGMLGIILTLTLFVALFARKPVRRMLRGLDLHRSRAANTLLVSSPWLFRLAVSSPLGIVLVDSYFYATSPTRASIDPWIREQQGDAGYFLDEFTAIKEIGLAFGRLILCGIAVVALTYFTLPVALIASFLVAALVSTWLLS